MIWKVAPGFDHAIGESERSSISISIKKCQVILKRKKKVCFSEIPGKILTTTLKESVGAVEEGMKLVGVRDEEVEDFQGWMDGGR